MVQAKRELFLTVPKALNSETYLCADLITPPSYIISAPPPLPAPSLSRSSSLSTNTSQSESDCELEDEEDEVFLRSDAVPWTIDQDEALLSTYSAYLDGPALPSAPFEASRPPPSVATQVSRNTIRNYGWRGRRSVSSARRRLHKLAREKYTEDQGERIIIDPLDSSSALSSMARVRAHPYARSNLPFGSKELHLHDLPLASPFHEKQLCIPSSPSPSTSRISLPSHLSGVGECDC